jgi:hypothetical protein
VPLRGEAAAAAGGCGGEQQQRCDQQADAQAVQEGSVVSDQRAEGRDGHGAAYTADPGSPSHDAINLLASWAATLDQAETVRAMDGP